MDFRIVIECFQAGRAPNGRKYFIRLEKYSSNFKNHLKKIGTLPKMFIFTASPIHEILALARVTETVSIEVER